MVSRIDTQHEAALDSKSLLSWTFHYGSMNLGHLQVGSYRHRNLTEGLDTL